MRFRRKKDGDTVPKYVIPTVKGHGWYKVTGDRTSRSTRSVTGGGHAGAPATLIEDDTPKRVGEQEQSWPENPNPRYRPTRSNVRPHRPSSPNPRPTPSRRHSEPKPPEHGRRRHPHPPSTTTSTSSTSPSRKRSGEHSMTRSEMRGARSSGRGPNIVRAGTTTKECRASSLHPTRGSLAFYTCSRCLYPSTWTVYTSLESLHSARDP